MADRYKVLSLNFKYVISVNHFVLGDLAIKSLFNILGAITDVAPLLNFLFFLRTFAKILFCA